MLLISGNNISKSFAGEILFENVSFNIYDKDKIGFVGVNGAGKTTLFKMIMDNMDYDNGNITKNKEIKIGYLEQYPVFDDFVTVMDEMLTLFSEVIQVEEQLNNIQMNLENKIGNIDNLINRQAELLERFVKLDGTHYKSKIKSVLKGLGFAEETFSMPINNLSGGEKTRLALCKILLSDTNFLLLDEPTNHLDIDSVEWLEDFLDKYKGAFVVISHDRFFLDRITNKTFVLENKKFRTYDGNYSEYVTQHEIEKLSVQRDYDWKIREIHRLEKVIEQQRRWKHKKNKKTHTLDNTKKMISRLENTLVKPEREAKNICFHFKASFGGANNVLTTQKLSMKFKEKMLFENVDINIRKGEKVFLLGPNGCGKTTLLKILLGQLQQYSGEYRIGDNIHVGYYDQLNENLSRNKNVIDEVWDDYPLLTQTEVRSALALFLFQGDDVFKSIKALSGGELARVLLTKLLLKDINFLIMDEPTNHLDISSREALESALYDYDGTMLMVSHDRYFINKLADKILYLTPKGIIEYEGNYDDYLENRQKKLVENQAKIKSKEENNKKCNNYQEKKRLEAEKRKLINKSNKIEKLIEEKEKKIENLEQECSNPEIAADYKKIIEISSKINVYRNDIDNLMEDWGKLLLEIEQIN